MTQQYLVGQLSALLGDLEGASADWWPAVHHLRRRVERAPPLALPELADEVLTLTDAICWVFLEDGDAASFGRCARSAAELAEFIEAAGLARC
jgi:hypothetical protein